MEFTVRHAVAEDAAAVHEIFLQDQVLAGTRRLPFAAPDYMRQRIAAQPGSSLSASPSSSPFRTIRANATPAR